MEPASVLVADSQRLFAESLAAALEEFDSFGVLREFPDTGQAAIDLVQLLHPSVAVVDYWLQGIPAPELVGVIRSHVPECRVIFLSGLVATGDADQVLAAGAAGYLSRGETVGVVAQAITELAEDPSRSQIAGAPAFTRALYEREALAAQGWRRLSRLSHREMQILALISAGRSAAEMAAELEVTEKTIRNYIAHLLSKAGAHSQSEVIGLARNCGLVAG